MPEEATPNETVSQSPKGLDQIVHAPSSRRRFLGAGAMTAASYERVLGANERIQMGFIGCGIIARWHLADFKALPEVDISATCDAYLPRAEQCVADFNPRAKAYQDFRRIIEDKNIQAVCISTPSHWHALMTIMACAEGKDVYVEKPLTVCVKEGRWMVEAARRYKRVVQVGTQQRSGAHYQKAATELLRGYLGKIVSIRSGSVRNAMPGFGKPADSAPPPGMDWDLFLGPAQRRPYNVNRGLYNFRWFWDTDGGQQTNMGTHEMDIVLWALQAKGSDVRGLVRRALCPRGQLRGTRHAGLPVRIPRGLHLGVHLSRGELGRPAGAGSVVLRHQRWFGSLAIRLSGVPG